MRKRKFVTQVQVRQFREMRPTHTALELEDIFEVNSKTIFRYTKGLPHPSRRTLDYNHILHLYFVSGCSVKQITERVGHSYHAVIRVLTIHGDNFVKQSDPKKLKRTCYESRKYQSQKWRNTKSNANNSRRSDCQSGDGEDDRAQA